MLQRGLVWLLMMSVPALAGETPPATACVVTAGAQLPDVRIPSAVTIKAARFEPKEKDAIAAAISRELLRSERPEAVLSGFGLFLDAEKLRGAIDDRLFDYARSIISDFLKKEMRAGGTVTFDITAFGHPISYVSQCATSDDTVYATPPMMK